MILIFTEKKDQSTCKVVEWLLFFKAKFIIITEDEFIEIVKLCPITGNFIGIIPYIIVSSNFPPLTFVK